MQMIIEAFKRIILVRSLVVFGMAKWVRARRNHRILEKLSNKTLCDIGIHRGEIASAARTEAARWAAEQIYIRSLKPSPCSAELVRPCGDSCQS